MMHQTCLFDSIYRYRKNPNVDLCWIPLISVEGKRILEFILCSQENNYASPHDIHMLFFCQSSTWPSIHDLFIFWWMHVLLGQKKLQPFWRSGLVYRRWKWKTEIRISSRNKKMESILNSPFSYYFRFWSPSRICSKEKGKMVYEFKARFKVY